MMTTGKPLLFNLDIYYATIENFIKSDEVETALWLAEHPPTYYQDYPPERLTKLKEQLHKQIWGPCQYAGIYKDVEITPAHTEAHWPLRGQLLETEIRALNEQGIEPMVCEFAPGSAWLEKGLQHKGLKFNYEYISVDGKKLSDKHSAFNIYCAFEIIEHCQPIELYQNSLKFNRSFDMVMVSTPLYCFDGGMAYVDGWEGDDHPLGHLRTYGPGGLHKIVSGLFKGYNWNCSVDNTIVLMGKR